MKWNQVKDNWDSVSRAILLTWGKLSDDDLEFICGDHNRLVAVLQKKYVITLPVAEARVENFVNHL